MKINKIPNADGIPNDGFGVAEGGTKNLGGVTTVMENQVNGVALSTTETRVRPYNVDPSSLSSMPNLVGPLNGVVQVASLFQITNFNFTRNYAPSSDNGTITITGDTVSFTPSIAGNTKFRLGGRTFTFPVTGVYVEQPVMVLPPDNTNIGPSISFKTSPFLVRGAVDTHAASDWQLSMDPDFTSILQSSLGSVVDKLTWTVSGLLYQKTYYVRVRHKGLGLGNSVWSEPFVFHTATDFNVIRPSITYPQVNQLKVDVAPVITATAFDVKNWEDVHLASEWEIARSSKFLQIVKTSGVSTVSKTSWNVGAGLAADSIYYVRVRYQGQDLGWSAWSLPVGFRTKPAV